jgi:hypothetical protein
MIGILRAQEEIILTELLLVRGAGMHYNREITKRD